jgi:hypothetical protein
MFHLGYTAENSATGGAMGAGSKMNQIKVAVGMSVLGIR